MPANWIRDYFTFTKKERIGVILLVGIILFVFFLPKLIPSRRSAPNANEIAAFKAMSRSLKKKSADSPQTEVDYALNLVEPSSEKIPEEKVLFYFDPNSATVKEWERLGMKPKTIFTIQHYLSKGGKFRKAEDLAKIYGLSSEEYVRLKPYVRIANLVDAKSALKGNDSNIKTSKGYYPDNSRPRSIISIIEINSTDTTALIMLPGIGSKLANRIIKFRDRLGGFYSIDQVGETYGLPDSTFQKIRPYIILGNQPLTQININEADEARLRLHPYINWSMAKALVAYRVQHGPFRQLEDLSGVQAILPEQLKRLIPYLSTY